MTPATARRESRGSSIVGGGKVFGGQGELCGCWLGRVSWEGAGHRLSLGPVCWGFFLFYPFGVPRCVGVFGSRLTGCY